MSKVSISGNASGTGVFTIQAPDSNVDRVLSLPDEAGTIDTLQRAGNVLQVVHTAKTNSFVGTSIQTGTGYYIDVTGLSATITPLSSTNKILVIANMYIGISAAGGGYQQSYRLKKSVGGVDSFPILGDGEGGRPRATGRLSSFASGDANLSYRMVMFNGTHQDTAGSTSSLTYQVELGGYVASPVVYLNRPETWQIAPNDYDTTPVSTLTLMEIAA